jgi:hypothetical protein
MRLRLPSLDQIAVGTRDAVLRFPAPVLAAAFATVAAFQLIADTPGRDEQPAIRLLATAMLALPLGVAGTVALARRLGGRMAGWLGIAVAALVIPLYWLGFPRWTETLQATRFAQLALLFHLLVACLPFLGSREPNAFWQFNRRLLERWLLGGIYASALFFGLAAAFGALDQLFGVNIPDRTYARLWVVMALLFHPLFFLAGVPRDLEALEPDDSWPGGLRAFARFVLVPLTTLYLLILTAYFVKVVVTGQWPSGWIGWLVSGAASVGILTLLLSGPPATRHEAPWAALFERWFWPALLPAAVMLALAIGKRIGQYGLTERRYFLAALTAWLFVAAVAFTLKRRRGLIFIPVTLAALAALTFAGPWGAYQVSKRSQFARLEVLLDSLGALEDGKLGKVAEGASVDAGSQAASVVRYLVSTHGPRPVVDWLAARDFTVPDLPPDTTRYVGSHAEPIITALGLQGFPSEGRPGWVWANREPQGAVDVAGWDWLVPLRQRVPSDTVWPGGDTLAAGLGLDHRSVEVRRGAALVAAIALGPTFDSVAAWRLRNAQENAPPDSLLVARAPDGRAMVYIRHLGLRDTAGTWKAEQFDGEVLLRGERVAGSGEQ